MFSWCFVFFSWFFFSFFFFVANTFVAEGLFLAKREIIVMPWQPELGDKLEQAGLTKLYLKASK